MSPERQSGILLHPTSLPGPYGMGEIGGQARAFASALVHMKQRVWQMLPLGPTGYADSPYQSLSSFAGNPMLIDLDDLVEEGLLPATRLDGLHGYTEHAVDFGHVIPDREAVLETVCAEFATRASRDVKRAFKTFCEKHADWLEDYALYVAIKVSQDGKAWVDWPAPLALRDKAALTQARRRYAGALRRARITQFLFDRQWQALRTFCHRRHIRIFGDVPIFVAHDSADVWAHPELFLLTPDGRLAVQSGVPPDYFSKTGQLWGNPLYDWPVHAESGYAWWIARMRRALEMVDLVRIDHFRGFEAHWEVRGDAATAEQGQWVKGPGRPFFQALREALGGLPVVAEDLGVITPEVEALRDDFELPGMCILQFAFGDDPKADDYKPGHCPENAVVYTGTHDNDTAVGWFHSEAGRDTTRTAQQIEQERRAVLEYLATTGEEIHWDMIRAGLQSDARLAVFPLQDLLGLGSGARMNVPGTVGRNWQWRLEASELTDAIKQRMRDLTVAAGRG